MTGVPVWSRGLAPGADVLQGALSKHFVITPARAPKQVSTSNLVCRLQASANRDRGGSRAHQVGTGSGGVVGSGRAVLSEHFVITRVRAPEQVSTSNLVLQTRASANRDRGGSRAHQGGTGSACADRITCAALAEHFVVKPARPSRRAGSQERAHQKQLGPKRVRRGVRAGGGGRKARMTARTAEIHSRSSNFGVRLDVISTKGQDSSGKQEKGSL